jgi:transcriptional regulator with XRE-family HTH domain
MTNLKKLLGNNLKIYRAASGLSQSKLAEKADTSTNYISVIEAGRRFPSIEMLERISLALKIDPLDLLSVKAAQSRRVKWETEEEIWTNIGQNLASYIAKNVSELKKQKAKERL